MRGEWLWCDLSFVYICCIGLINEICWKVVYVYEDLIWSGSLDLGNVWND